MCYSSVRLRSTIPTKLFISYSKPTNVSFIFKITQYFQNFNSFFLLSQKTRTQILTRKNDYVQKFSFSLPFFLLEKAQHKVTNEILQIMLVYNCLLCASQVF